MKSLKTAAIAALTAASLYNPAMAADKNVNQNASQSNDTEQLQTWRKPGCSGDCSIIIR